jgi:hypothetical protein
VVTENSLAELLQDTIVFESMKVRKTLFELVFDILTKSNIPRED